MLAPATKATWLLTPSHQPPPVILSPDHFWSNINKCRSRLSLALHFTEKLPEPGGAAGGQGEGAAAAEGAARLPRAQEDQARGRRDLRRGEVRRGPRGGRRQRVRGGEQRKSPFTPGKWGRRQKVSPQSRIREFCIRGQEEREAGGGREEVINEINTHNQAAWAHSSDSW